VVTVLVDGGGTELLASVVGEFTMAAVLVDDTGAELLAVVFPGCVDVIGGVSCSVILLASHVEAALVVDVVGTRSLGAGSLVVLGTGLFWQAYSYSWRLWPPATAAPA
jgi:hypothetical protein